jgi:hypothetical protein
MDRDVTWPVVINGGLRVVVVRPRQYPTTSVFLVIVLSVIEGEDDSATSDKVGKAAKLFL